jgi:hypothetical protein
MVPSEYVDFDPHHPRFSFPRGARNLGRSYCNFSGQNITGIWYNEFTMPVRYHL